jgi:antitoxin ParD1/3/4
MEDHGEPAKLEALREAARVGFAAFDRGGFKEFADAKQLVAYLYKFSEKVISCAMPRR